jgi:hypothetical protein
MDTTTIGEARTFLTWQLEKEFGVLVGPAQLRNFYQSFRGPIFARPK